jgi:hypothetical protein
MVLFAAAPTVSAEIAGRRTFPKYRVDEIIDVIKDLLDEKIRIQKPPV